MVFYALLNGVVLVRVVLESVGCVCVAGVAVREDWAVLLLPGGLRRKERCYESVCVCVGGCGWRGEIF